MTVHFQLRMPPVGYPAQILAGKAEVSLPDVFLFTRFFHPSLDRGEQVSGLWRQLIQGMAKYLMSTPIPLRQVRPDAPEALERLIDAMLEKDPQDRPPAADAGKVLHDVAQVMMNSETVVG